MEINYTSKNISYLLDNKVISPEKLVEITKHNSTGLVSMWKSGERKITTSDLITIANYLNVTIDDLVNKDIRDVLNKKTNYTSIDDVKKAINNLNNEDMKKDYKDTLINMVDYYHIHSKQSDNKKD